MLLDTHPTLDLTALGDCGVIFDQGDTLGDGSPPISTVQLHGETGSIAVLLAPTDAPFTTDLRNAPAFDGLSLRFWASRLSRTLSLAFQERVARQE